MYVYSKKLENQLIDYFKRKYGLEISPEQAQDYLDSLADLVLAFEPKNNTT